MAAGTAIVSTDEQLGECGTLLSVAGGELWGPVGSDRVVKRQTLPSWMNAFLWRVLPLVGELAAEVHTGF